MTFSWDAAAMASDEDRRRLAEYVTSARRAHGWNIEQARAAAGGMNRQTWERAERGETVREDTYSRIERALGWTTGDVWRILAGMEPLAGESERPTPREQAPPAGKFAQLRAHIENWPDLPDHIRRAILALLDSAEGGNSGDNPGDQSRGA